MFFRRSVPGATAAFPQRTRRSAVMVSLGSADGPALVPGIAMQHLISDQVLYIIKQKSSTSCIHITVELIHIYETDDSWYHESVSTFDGRPYWCPSDLLMDQL